MVIAIMLYKFIGGRLPKLKEMKKEFKEKKQIEEDTLVECEKCGTFVTYKESIITRGKIYCSKECAGF
jgi:uncharacterized protein